MSDILAYEIFNNWDRFLIERVREAFKKKTAKFGNCSQIAGDPPTLAYLGILNCYFFIGYLGLLDHEMDFEINLFFSFTKVA